MSMTTLRSALAVLLLAVLTACGTRYEGDAEAPLDVTRRRDAATDADAGGRVEAGIWDAGGVDVRVADCPMGTTRCGDVCTGTNVDPMNCGACGVVCPVGQFCSDGGCRDIMCPAGTTLCGGRCAHPGRGARGS